MLISIDGQPLSDAIKVRLYAAFIGMAAVSFSVLCCVCQLLDAMETCALPVFGLIPCSLLLALILDFVTEQSESPPPTIIMPKKILTRTDKDDDEMQRTSESSTCPICLSEFQEGDTICYGHFCRHSFHAGCIKQWLAFTSHRPSCPCCRQDLTRPVDAGMPTDGIVCNQKCYSLTASAHCYSLH